MKEMEERSGRAMMEKAAEAAMLEEALSKCEIFKLLHVISVNLC